MSKKRSMVFSKDELELISRKLTFDPDYIRFRSVCKSWRSAAPKRPQLPWLIVQNDSKLSDKETTLFNLYQFSFEANKFTQIPGLTKSSLPSFNDDLTVCVGSSHGWVALFKHSTSSVWLFNPLTKSTVDLPNLQNWGHICSSSEINTYRFSFNLTSNPSDSLSDCFALIHCSPWILFCKIGSTDWIEMRCPPFEVISDFQFCSYRGKIFVASGIDVYVCDFGWLGWNPSISKIFTVSPKDAPVRNERMELSYLVELDGDLLLVLVYYGCCIYCYPDYKFQVFKLEFGWQQVKLVELKSLGDKSLFLGLKSAFFLTASKYPGCKPNCIYLPMISYNYKDRSITQLLINYDFEKGESVLVHDDSDPEDLDMFHCAWFTPNLLR